MSKTRIRVEKGNSVSLVAINDMFEVARSNNLGMPQRIYNKPNEYEWGLIFDNGEVFSRVDIPDRALLKNEIKKALAYKMGQEQSQGQKLHGPDGPTLYINASRHQLLHIRGHKCEDCEKCEECSALDPAEVDFAKRVKEKSGDGQCPTCSRIIREHSDKEFIQCFRAATNASEKRFMDTPCPECGRQFREHSKDELIHCIRT